MNIFSEKIFWAIVPILVFNPPGLFIPLMAYQVQVNDLVCETLGIGCPIHELTVELVCGKGEEDVPEIARSLSSRPGHIICSEAELNALVKGVRLPDEKSCNNELVSDFIDQTLAFDGKKNIHPLRVSHQHIHSSPLPLPKNFKKSFTTNQQWRNQMLMQTSVWYCSALAAPDELGWLKLGTIFHTLGDSYSESHVKRVLPEGSSKDQPCGPDNRLPILQGYSMDVASWHKHIVPDRDVNNIRFSCLIQQMADIIQFTRAERKIYLEASSWSDRLEIADRAMGKLISYLCKNSWYMESHLLPMPAGGITKPYSSTGKTVILQTLVEIKDLKSYLVKNQGVNWYAPRDGDLCKKLSSWSVSPERFLKCSLKELEEAASSHESSSWTYLEHRILSQRLEWTDGQGFEAILPWKKELR